MNQALSGSNPYFIVTVSLDTNFPTPIEITYPCLVKFRQLFLSHFISTVLTSSSPAWYLSSLFGPRKNGLRGKHYASDEEVKKKRSREFARQGYMLSFEVGTLILKSTVTMLKSRDVIHHRGLVSFWCTIHVLLSVIIPILKKKVLRFDPPSYTRIKK